MPPAPRRPRPPSDDISVWVTVPVVVSEKKWKAAMRAKGIDMTGVVTAASVASFTRAAVVAVIENLSVAPNHVIKQRTGPPPKGES